MKEQPIIRCKKPDCDKVLSHRKNRGAYCIYHTKRIYYSKKRKTHWCNLPHWIAEAIKDGN